MTMIMPKSITTILLLKSITPIFFFTLLSADSFHIVTPFARFSSSRNVSNQLLTDTHRETSKYSFFLEMATSPSEGNRKRKRRRKKANKKPESEPELSDNDNLPEFDLMDDIETNIAEESSRLSQEVDVVTPPVPSNTVNNVEPVVSFDSAESLLRSRDKNLEATFEFEEVENRLPSFASSNLPKVGKKRAKSEARKSAAIKAEMLEKEEESNSFLPFLNSPFFNSLLEDESDLGFVKILEKGTWACIYLVIAWEIYINSPLFERSAPISPVVY